MDRRACGVQSMELPEVVHDLATKHTQAKMNNVHINPIRIDLCTRLLIVALLTIAKDWGQINCHDRKRTVAFTKIKRNILKYCKYQV